MSAFEYTYAGHSFRVETAYSVIPHGEFVEFFRTCVGELRSAGLVAPEGAGTGSVGAGHAVGAGSDWRSRDSGGASYFDGGGAGFGGPASAGQRDSARAGSGFRGGRAGFSFRGRTWRDDNRGVGQLCQGDDVVTGGVNAARPGLAPRGPNYERNKADRERKKLAKAKRGQVSDEVAALREQVEEEELRRRLAVLQNSAGTEANKARLAGMRLTRALAVEEQKAARSAAGFDHVTEALRLAKDAVTAAELAKYQPVAAVAGWAATVASSGAESVAKSSSSGISLKSVSSATSASGFAAAKGPLNVVESLLVENSVTTEKVIRSARAKVGRKLGMDDIFRSDAPFRMTNAVKREIALAGAGLPKEESYNDRFGF